MVFTTVYMTDLDISVVIFIVETIITALLFLIKLLKPMRELREIYEYKKVKKRGYVEIRGHSIVRPPLVVHFFTFGLGYKVLLLLVTVGMMGTGMIGPFVATDSKDVSLERRNWATCRDWVAENESERLLEGMNFANFVCCHFFAEESSGVFFDGEGLRCSDFNFKPMVRHCTVLGFATKDNCNEHAKLKAVHGAISNGGYFRITELRNWKESTLLTPQFNKVWAEFGTNGTVLGNDLIVTCRLVVGFEVLESLYFDSHDFHECFFVTGGVYFFTTGFSKPLETPSLGKRVSSFGAKIQNLIVDPGRTIRSASTGTLVDVG